jgi:hypothetical protein
MDRCIHCGSPVYGNASNIYWGGPQYIRMHFHILGYPCIWGCNSHRGVYTLVGTPPTGECTLRSGKLSLAWMILYKFESGCSGLNMGLPGATGTTSQPCFSTGPYRKVEGTNNNKKNNKRNKHKKQQKLNKHKNKNTHTQKHNYNYLCLFFVVY